MAETQTRQWIYVFTAGPRPELATVPEAWTDDDRRVAAAHFSYLRRALDDGVLLVAGRSQDGVGPAIVVFEAEDRDAAKAFMEGDPFVAGGLFGASLHPYRAALMRGTTPRA